METAQAPEGRKKMPGTRFSIPPDRDILTWVFSVVPAGTRFFPPGNPPMNRWAIVGRPSGTQELRSDLAQR